MPALAHVAVQSSQNPLALGRRKPLDVLGEIGNEEVTAQCQPADCSGRGTSLPQNGDTARRCAFLFIGKYLAPAVGKSCEKGRQTMMKIQRQACFCH